MSRLLLLGEVVLDRRLGDGPVGVDLLAERVVEREADRLPLLARERLEEPLGGRLGGAGGRRALAGEGGGAAGRAERGEQAAGQGGAAEAERADEVAPGDPFRIAALRAVERSIVGHDANLR